MPALSLNGTFPSDNGFRIFGPISVPAKNRAKKHYQTTFYGEDLLKKAWMRRIQQIVLESEV